MCDYSYCLDDVWMSGESQPAGSNVSTVPILVVTCMRPPSSAWVGGFRFCRRAQRYVSDYHLYLFRRN